MKNEKNTIMSSPLNTIMITRNMKFHRKVYNNNGTNIENKISIQITILKDEWIIANEI